MNRRWEEGAWQKAGRGKREQWNEEEGVWVERVREYHMRRWRWRCGVRGLPLNKWSKFARLYNLRPGRDYAQNASRSVDLWFERVDAIFLFFSSRADGAIQATLFHIRFYLRARWWKIFFTRRGGGELLTRSYVLCEVLLGRLDGCLY